jgi:hypothetical protein
MLLKHQLVIGSRAAAGAGLIRSIFVLVGAVRSS